MSIELRDTISRNIYTRMSPVSFDNEILSKRKQSVDEITMRKVIEGTHFISKDQLDECDIRTGDVFKEETEDGVISYYLNIRAQCDLVRNQNPML